MSRYTELSAFAQAVYRHIQPHSSMRPISLGDLLRAHRDTSEDIPNALQALIDARLITTMRHTLNGVTQNVYWPTGLKPITAPSLEEIRMSAEPKNSQLAAMIVKHGPISGTDLAAKATAAGLNCPTKNVQGILAGHLTRGEIILKKRNAANWYMTPNQAAEWDGNVATAGGDRDNPAAAHVMSAPASAKQSGGNFPVNETEQGEEVAALKSQIHGLLNDVIAANLIFSQLAETLKVDHPEQIPGALDELTHALATRAMQADQPAGRLALLLIDSADLTEIEELDKYDTPNAQQLAVRTVEQGNAARAIVVRILGEASRKVEWEAA